MTGKGLAFLHKKSWHVTNLNNVEEVWKREQEAAAEKKKIEQLKREKMEEAKIAELRALADARSGRVRENRVEWLYEQPLQKTSAEEYLLGKKVENWDDTAEGVAAASGAKEPEEITEEKPGSIWLGDKLDPTVDTASKIRDDPLFAIKQRERDALKTILDNPMQMKLLRDQVKGKKEKKRLKKLEKKQKKREKSSSSRKRRRSPSPGSSSRRARRSHHSRSPSPRHHTSSGSSSSRRERTSGNEDDERRHRKSRRRNSRSPERKGDSKLSDTRFKNQNYEHYKKMAEERAKSTWKREKRKPLTEEEKAARLAQMSNDAEQHEQARHRRLRREKEQAEKEAKELAERAKRDVGAPSFIGDMNKQVMEDVKSLGDQLGRERHYIDKSVTRE